MLAKRWDKLYRVAFACCHNPDLAGDLVQDTLEKALRKHHQIKNPDSVDAWLFSILFNCWRDYCRRDRHMEDIDNLGLAHDQSPPREHERTRIVQMVQTALAKLSFDQRQVIALVDLADMRYADVAYILDVPIGTVMSRVCRARRALKQYLDDPGQDAHQSSTVRRIK